MDAIVAVYEDWGIGDGTTQPVVLKADRKHFRELTAGAALIVGRKTMEDFPEGKPLPGRTNIVVTRRAAELPGALVAHSVEEALALAADYPNCFVIGGDSVFRQFLPYTDRVFLTKIQLRPHSSAFFPELDSDPAWLCSEEGPEQEENGIVYSFSTYIRK